MDFIYFLGRFHVLVLHLPIGILLAAVVLEFLARLPRYRHLEVAVPYLLLTGAISAIAAATLGYMHSLEGGFDGPSVTWHMRFGIGLAVFSTVAWLLCIAGPTLYRRLRYGIAAGIVFLMTATGHYGGNITHGDTYLFEYAPGPVRQLAGMEAKSPAAAAPTSLAAADPFEHIVRPMLERRCASCHNNDKQRGGFSVASFEAISKGGDGGPALVPGTDKGEMLRRVSLPASHKDFMPADGKTPLTPEEVEVLRWWAQAGAPQGVTLASIEIPEDVRGKLVAVSGLAGADGERPAAGPDVAALDPAKLARLRAAGFNVRPVIQDSPLLELDYSTAGKPFGDEQAAALADASEQVVWLNLRNSSVGDRHLATIGKLRNLADLRLEQNPVSDAGLAQLQALKSLRTLNLRDTQVSAVGVRKLAALPKLERVYVWGSRVAPDSGAQLAQLREGLRIDVGTTR